MYGGSQELDNQSMRSLRWHCIYVTQLSKSQIYAGFIRAKVQYMNHYDNHMKNCLFCVSPCEHAQRLYFVNHEWELNDRMEKLYRKWLRGHGIMLGFDFVKRSLSCKYNFLEVGDWNKVSPFHKSVAGKRVNRTTNKIFVHLYFNRITWISFKRTWQQFMSSGNSLARKIK